MSLTQEQKKIAELHEEYQSLVKFFTFAVKKAEIEEDKQKFQFQLKMCKAMKEVTRLLFLCITEQVDKK